ncbi:MAG: hypothetical protein K0S33_1574 [Bacteroidetes bacterium]|jgi:Mlc titration factor MtfA (ptsG expression regulator)|nr:hypothetical protein [Bacteroidota bacterium]
MIHYLLYTGLLSTSNIFSLAGIILLLFLLIDTFLLNITGIKDWLFYIFKREVIVSEEESDEIRGYLQEILYFNQLSEKGKERFINRTLYVIKRLHFSSSDVLRLTTKNKALIASSIVQLTFGLSYYYIHTIRHIRVFQKEIMNPRTKQRFYGLMFSSGKMYLSWERFEQGIKINDDGLNLGIHETTHGLLILLKHHKLNYDEFDFMLDTWYRMAEKHIISDTNKEGFFRKYAAANTDEFFSVLAENFFERPAEFKKRMPELYNEVCVFFYQDPTNASNDFRINTQQQAIAEGLSYSGSSGVKPLNLIKDRWHWSFTALVLFGYMSYIFILVLKNYLASSFGPLFISYILSFPFVYFFLKKVFVGSGRMSKRHYTVMSFFSLGPIVLMLIGVLNFCIPVSESISKKYTIKRIQESSGLTINDGDLSFLDGFTTFCELNSDDSYSIIARRFNGESASDTIVINYHYGITGLKVFDGNDFIRGK